MMEFGPQFKGAATVTPPSMPDSGSGLMTASAPSYSKKQPVDTFRPAVKPQASQNRTPLGSTGPGQKTSRVGSKAPAVGKFNIKPEPGKISTPKPDMLKGYTGPKVQGPVDIFRSSEDRQDAKKFKPKGPSVSLKEADKAASAWHEGNITREEKNKVYSGDGSKTSDFSHKDAPQAKPEKFSKKEVAKTLPHQNNPEGGPHAIHGEGLHSRIDEHLSKHVGVMPSNGVFA